MAKFCTNCGRSLDGAGAFCKYCGAPLSAQPQSAPAQQPAQAAQPQQWAQQPQQAQPQQWAQPQQAQSQQWAQPVQQAQPQQWAQPQSQWSPPRTGAGTPQGSAWQQPASSGEWQPISTGGTGTRGAAGWAATAAAAVRNPAGQIQNAWNNYEDSRYPASGGNSGVPAPGWSARINDPELLAALQKQRKAAKKAGAIIIPLPLIGFAIYGAISDKMSIGQALIYGAIVSIVFLIFALIGKKQSDPNKSYEATVVDKQTHRRRRRESSGDDDYSYTTYTELVTVAKTTAGQTKKITERDDNNPVAWDYLRIGERFRYHPQLGFPYELYDKSHAPYLACPVCSRKHAVTEDRCRKCGAPLLK